MLRVIVSGANMGEWKNGFGNRQKPNHDKYGHISKTSECNIQHASSYRRLGRCGPYFTVARSSRRIRTWPIGRPIVSWHRACPQTRKSKVAGRLITLNNLKVKRYYSSTETMTIRLAECLSGDGIGAFLKVHSLIIPSAIPEKSIWHVVFNGSERNGSIQSQSYAVDVSPCVGSNRKG